MRKRSTAVVLGPVLVAVMAACSPSPAPEYVEVCEDAVTQIRVADEECPDDGDGHSGTRRTRRTYHSSSSYIPPVGSRVSGGSTVRPAGGSISRVPASGGFGGSKGSVGS